MITSREIEYMIFSYNMHYKIKIKIYQSMIKNEINPLFHNVEKWPNILLKS